jgi:hypothetical protein
MEFIGLTSLSMCSANSFLPWMGMDGIRANSVIPATLVEEKIVDSNTGRLDRIRLHQKINELAAARQYARAIR